MRSTFRLAASVIVSALLVGCSDSAQARKEHFDNAERFMAAGQTQEAIIEYRNALQADARYGEARLRLSEAYQAAGNANQAYREAIRAADLLPQNSDAQIRAARYLMTAGQFEDAKTRIQIVVDRDPTNAAAQLILGHALARLKDLDGAVRQIEEAIRLEPDRGLTYTSLAAVKMEQGQRDQANAAFEKAVQVDPKSVEARLALAYYRWSIGDTVGAEDALKKAVSVDATNVLANRTLAAFYMGSNRAPLAEPYLKALAASGSPQATIQLADYYTAQRRPADAKALLQPLTKVPAVATAADTRLAAIAYAANDQATAHGLVDAVILRDPTNAEARVLRARWLLRERKPEAALTVAQSAVSADPRNAGARYVLGTVYDTLGRRKEAIAEFNETLQLNPRATAAQVHLSRLNLIEGTPDNAVAFAEGALATAPDDPNARLGLVRGLLARRDTSRAEQELVPLLKKYPQAGTVHAVDGSVKAQKQDYGGARAAYTRALELSPKSTEALAGLTSLDLMQKKGADARARIERSLGEDPNNIGLLMIAGRVYLSQRDFPRAEASLRKAIQSDPAASTAYPMLATVLLASGKLEAARVEFDQIAQRDPKNVAAATMGAMIVHSQGKKADAKKRYEAIVGATPTAPVAANNLAWMYQEDNERLDEALRLAQNAAARMPNSAEVQDTIGMIYFKKELPALAVSAFERSVEKAPENPDYHYHLAMALAKAGESARARAAAAQAVKLKPDFADAQKLLAQTKG